MALLGETHESINILMSRVEEAFRLNSDLTTLKPPKISNLFVFETDLTALTTEQRLTFEIIVGVLCVLSLSGNLCTLYVNSRRKMRPFFRTCLISLALSDLLNTVFLTWTHYPQFIAEYVQIWLLGPVMCRFIPQVTTAAILASSMTLVGIAADRYFAVMKAVVSFWNPGIGFCFIFAFGIWITSFGIAAPLCFIYRTLTVWIVPPTEEDPVTTTTDWPLMNSENGQPNKLITMCVSDQKDVALYYVIVFSIIFVPCIVAFVWLNAIIAQKIWTRRHRAPHKTEQMTVNYPKQNLAYADDPFKSGYSSGPAAKPAAYNSAREARHIRMFIVILVLMAVFIILRLPAWIFLVMRMYGNYSKPHDWIVFFSFGVLNLASSALNPLFYTFMPETLQYLSCCKQTLCPKTHELTTECRAKSCLRSSQCQTHIPCCICCGFMCCCNRGPNVSLYEENTKPPRPLGFEHDEGVDCCDASYGDEDEENRKREFCLDFSATLPATNKHAQQQQRY